uniref:NADH dehydrogenase subunit 4L n=1 Tax=Megalophaedusa nankaidoensis TaxID=1885872 RepID=A0A224AAY9_9EUPU|nr:NADH dehydrogenase subunit 4L [Megalophaedusa nankaidoensis]
MVLLIMLTMLLVFLTFVLFSSKHYFLSSLLVLESMVLLSVVFTLFLFWLAEGNLSFFVLVLTISVCEAGMAFSLLMSFIKNSGSANIGT